MRPHYEKVRVTIPFLLLSGLEKHQLISLIIKTCYFNRLFSNIPAINKIFHIKKGRESVIILIN